MMLPAVEAAIARSSDPTVEGVYHQRWARVLHVNGKIKEAEASSSKALDLLEKALGADHVRVAIARNDHALILRFAGKPDEALTYARDALRVVEAERGPNHPDLMAILNMIAMITKDSDPKSAKAMLLRAIEILRADKERVGGFDDGALQNTIGNTYVRLGEFQKAGASFHNALVIFEKLGGADSREARIMRLGVAKAAFHEQDLKTATKHVQIVAASYDKTKVPRLHINRIAFYYRSGRIAHAAGDTKSALSHFNNGLAVLRSVNPKHPASIMYQTWIARVLADSGDAAAARRHLDRALAPRMAKRAFHETDIPALTLLGQLFLDQRQPNKALELLEAAAKRVGKGTRIERLAEMRATLAQALIETNGDRQRALGLLKQALPWYTSRTTPAYKRHRDRLLAWMKKQKIPAP